MSPLMRYHKDNAFSWKSFTGLREDVQRSFIETGLPDKKVPMSCREQGLVIKTATSQKWLSVSGFSLRIEV